MTKVSQRHLLVRIIYCCKLQKLQGTLPLRRKIRRSTMTSKATDIEEGATESTDKEEIILEADAVEVPAPTLFGEVLERGRASAEGVFGTPSSTEAVDKAELKELRALKATMERDKMMASLKEEISQDLRREMSASSTKPQSTSNTIVVNTVNAGESPAPKLEVYEEQEEPPPERHWSVLLFMVIGSIIAGILIFALMVAKFLCQCICEILAPNDEVVVVRRGFW